MASHAVAIGMKAGVLIVGGGLAGMAAAVALESAGAQVTLIEASRRLGGRAGSFSDPQSGELLDNCQHVLLGCCTNLIDFYRRIDALRFIRFERSIRFCGPDGRRWALSGLRGLPAPLHLGWALARLGLLGVRDRMQVAWAMVRILRTGPAQMKRLESVPFGQWLDERGQSEQIVSRLYDPIVVSGLNERTRDVAASWAIKIFRDALLANSGGYVIGVPDCPLVKLYERLPALDVRLGIRLAELCFDGRRVTGIRTQDGQTLAADAVVLATNYHAVRQWIPPELLAADRRFDGLDQLQSSPILGAHLWYDRPVMDVSHLALVEGPLQWLFRKDREGRAIHGVISAARDWVNVPRDQCLRQFDEQVRRILGGAKLERGVVVIEKRATFSPLPGAERFRPGQKSPEGGIDRLYLAGDYTQTGWPATMEGAVRSGYLAAEAVLGCPAGTFLVPDLSPQWPARSMRHFSTGRTTSTAAR